MTLDEYRRQVQHLLSNLAESMARAGVSQKITEQVFTEQLSIEDNLPPEREAVEDDVRDTLDRITGWCHNKIVFQN